MKKHLVYFRRVRRDLLWLLGLSVTAYIGIEIASAWPAPSFWMWRVGQGFSTLSMAYITAFIFYYFVNHIAEERDRELLAQMAIRPLEYLQMGNDEILRQVLKQDSFKSEDLSFPEIKDIVRRIDLDAHFDHGVDPDAPQDDTFRAQLELWYGIAQRYLTELFGHGLRIDADILSYLLLLREHTAKDFKYVKGRMDTDRNTVNRYRIAETAYFTNVLIKWMRRYPYRTGIEDDEFNMAMKRNREYLHRELIRLDEQAKKQRS